MAPGGYGDRVEGVHSVAAALANGRVEKLFVERARQTRLREVLDLADQRLITIVDDVRSLAETEAPQGIVAHCRPIAPVTLEALATDDAALLVLDHVEDPHNVGAA
ncbi:MAG: RNA methyltransferase substrate-binding domain-containing protein, partial [Acidimicrobiia bacterium]